MRLRVTRACLFVPLFLVAFLMQPRPCRALTDTQVNNAIVDMDSEDFFVRDKASKLLITNVENLTANQLKTLRAKAVDASQSLEARRRIERVLGEWIEFVQQSATTQVLNKIQVKGLGHGPTGIHFVVGPFNGTASFTDETAIVNFIKMCDLYEKARNLLLGGNANVAATQAAIQALHDKIQNMGNQEFLDLFGATSKADILNKILQGKNAVPEVVEDLNDLSGGAPPGGRLKRAIGAAGVIDMGKSLRLALTAVTLAGELDSFNPTETYARSIPPAGYQFIGHVYDMLAENGLEVSGNVSVAIEYGHQQAVGGHVLDPMQLRMVRLADAEEQLLTNCVYDTAAAVMTCQYTPPSAASGLTQFGEFAVVQPVTALPGLTPLGAALVLLGCAATGLRALRAQRQKERRPGERDSAQLETR